MHFDTSTSTFTKTLSTLRHPIKTPPRRIARAPRSPLAGAELRRIVADMID